MDIQQYVNFCLQHLDLPKDWAPEFEKEVSSTLQLGHDIDSLYDNLMQIINRGHTLVLADMIILNNNGLGTLFWCWVMYNLDTNPLFKTVSLLDAIAEFSNYPAYNTLNSRNYEHPN